MMNRESGVGYAYSSAGRKLLAIRNCRYPCVINIVLLKLSSLPVEIDHGDFGSKRTVY